MNTFMVCYDVCEPKRLRKMHRTMKGFGSALQFSVFRCSLSPKNYQIMLMRIEEVIEKSEDSVMIVNLGPREGMWEERMTFIGERKDLVEEQYAYIF